MNLIWTDFVPLLVAAALVESSLSAREEKAKRHPPKRIIHKTSNVTTSTRQFLPGRCEGVKLCCPGRIDGCVTPEFCYCDEFCSENDDCCSDYPEYCQGKFRCWELDLNGNPCNKIDTAATCIDSSEDPPQIQCNCSPGYVFSSVWKTCVQDLCSSGPCGLNGDTGASCEINEDLKSFTCKCSEGYFGPGCEYDPCAHGECCKSGYVLSKNKKCVILNGCMKDDGDFNPCNNKGDIGAQCLPGFASDTYACSCSGGWLFDGESCATKSCGSVDQLDGNPCNNYGDHSASCFSDVVVGTHNCSCSKGWVFSEGVCKDMCTLSDPMDRNPCNDLGDSEATCYMSKGAYSCSCSIGWIFNGGTCSGVCALADALDANPCNNNGDVHGVCKISTGGSYSCECSPGFQSANGMCIDINECQKPYVCNDCGSCRNTVGSYFCVCGPGYRVTDDGKNCESTLATWLNVLGVNR